MGDELEVEFDANVAFESAADRFEIHFCFKVLWWIDTLASCARLLRLVWRRHLSQSLSITQNLSSSDVQDLKSKAWIR